MLSLLAAVLLSVSVSPLRAHSFAGLLAPTWRAFCLAITTNYSFLPSFGRCITGYIKKDGMARAFKRRLNYQQACLRRLSSALFYFSSISLSRVVIMLKTKNLSVAYGKNTIIPDLSVSIPQGKITALIGQMAGKSTLLKTLARINKPVAGEIFFNDKPLSSYGDKRLARSLSLLPQILVSPEGITVRKLVEYGRSPYLSHWGRLGKRIRA